MQKLRKRIGLATLFALPIALGASLLTNLEDPNSSVVSNDEMTLSHAYGYGDHEDDGNTWNQLTASVVNQNSGIIAGSETVGQMTYYYLSDSNFISLDSFNITITGNVTLCLNGSVLKGNENGSVITISNGASLTLEDCKYENTDYLHDYYLDTTNNIWILGDSDDSQWRADLSLALANNPENVGKVYGGVITGGKTSGNGGGILNNGTLIMDGGIVAGNYASGTGGGVYVSANASFTMNNGSISGNCGYYSGGGVGVADATMIMNSGTISNNEGIGGGGAIDAVRATITINYGNLIYNSSNRHSTSACFYYAYTSIYVKGGYYTGGFYDDQYNNNYISGGYFPYSISSNYLAIGYISVNIANLGGKDYDDNYEEGFDYAVYKEGTTLISDAPTLKAIEDIYVCPDVTGYVENIQINVKYSSIESFINLDLSGLLIEEESDFPTTTGIHTLAAKLINVLVEIDGEKTYYSSDTIEFYVYIYDSHTPGDVTIENENSVTCTEDGSYDEVYYCLACNTENSRETITVYATGHNVKYVIDSDNDLEYWQCTVCKKIFLETTLEELTDSDTGEVEPEPEPGTDPDPDTGTGGDVDTEPDTGSDVEPDTGSDVNPDTGTDTEPDTNPDAGSDVDVNPDTGSEGLTGGVIAGIVIVSIVVLGGGAFLTFYLLKRKKVLNTELDLDEAMKAKEEAKAAKLEAKAKTKEEKNKLKEEKAAEKAKLKEEKEAEKARLKEEKAKAKEEKDS